MMKNKTTNKPWTIGNASDREYWDEKYENAMAFTKTRDNLNSILIEVAAQHPLINGYEPNVEFKERLNRGFELFKQYNQMGYNVNIYVPGSKHVLNGVADSISLSQSGTAFLNKLGISTKYLHGDDLNIKYKGNQGVYSSADECFVASSYYKEGNFGKLISVASPVQVMRKFLFYIEFGVFPFIYSVPVEDMYHNLIGEIFEAIPYVLFIDHNLQSKSSIHANELRRQRNPDQTNY